MSNPYVEQLKELPARLKQVHQEAMKTWSNRKIQFKLDSDMLAFAIINGFLLLLLLFLQLFVFFVLNYSSDVGWFSFFAGYALFWVFLRPSPDEKLSVQGFLSNFDGSTQFKPRKIYKPTSAAEIVEIIKTSASEGYKVKVFGSGSSFNAIGQTKHNIILLDLYKRVLHVDSSANTVKVEAGIKLGNLTAELWKQGLSIPNLPWLSLKTVGGAIQDNSHASSLKHGGFATRVTEIELITASGEVIVASDRQNQDIFNAARNGLGCLGVVSTVTLRCEPASYLKKVTQIVPLNEVTSDLQARAKSNEYFSCWWIPHTKKARLFIAAKADKQSAASVKTADAFKARAIQFANQLVATVAAKVLITITAFLDMATATSLDLLTIVFKNDERVVPNFEALFENWGEVFPRWSEFAYYVPVENANEAFTALQNAVNSGGWKLNFPCRISFVAKDNVWLSEAYERDSCCFQVAMYNRPTKLKQFSKKIDGIFKKFNARPALSKAHTLTKEDLETLFPRWNDFQEVRKRLDPKGLFMNEYLQTTFGQ